MKRLNQKRFDIILITIIALFVIVVFSMYFIDFNLFNEDIYDKMLREFLLRILGSLVFIYFLVRYGYKDLFLFPLNKKDLVFIIPALLVALNNFPISAYLAGRYTLEESNTMYSMFVLDSLGVGIFEEIIFRGLLLTVLIQYLPKTKHDNFIAIVLSASIFGAAHFINLGYGAFIGDTLMQVGYSFLMGLMWAVVFLKTRNIWMTALLHAAYNYCGMVLFQAGSVENRFDTVTIVATILVAVLVGAYYAYQYTKMDVIKE